jgi:hypothetical protein
VRSGWYDRKTKLIRDLSCGDTQVYLRVIQRKAYGLRDEEYQRLKILTCMLLP